MGCGSSILVAERQAKFRINDKLDEAIANDAKIEGYKIKLLILGTGESGKR
jgi:hypothetical protein